MKHVLTNVRLPLATLQGLKHRAVEERRPAAALVREAVAQYLTRPPASNESRLSANWLRRVVGSAGGGRQGPADLAAQHDHYLYGTPKNTQRRHRTR